VFITNQKAISGELDSGHDDKGEKGEDEGGEDGDDQSDDEDVSGTGHNAARNDNNDMAWVDKYILETRRDGGRLTEMSVLKTYKVSDYFCGPSPLFGPTWC
jgi:hypothetical protein